MMELFASPAHKDKVAQEKYAFLGATEARPEDVLLVSQEVLIERDCTFSDLANKRDFGVERKKWRHKISNQQLYAGGNKG
jgi:hypothetical protein